MNMDSVEVALQILEAAGAGLSPQGMSNPSSVQAAARLAEYDANTRQGQTANQDHGKSSRTVMAGTIKLVIPEKPTVPGPEGKCAFQVHERPTNRLTFRPFCFERVYTRRLLHVRLCNMRP